MTDDLVSADLELVGSDGEMAVVSVTDIVAGDEPIGQRVVDAIESTFEGDDVVVRGGDDILEGVLVDE